MKLSDWAKKQGISYRTAHRWFQAGILPCPSRQLSTGTILVDEVETKNVFDNIVCTKSKTDFGNQFRQLKKLIEEAKIDDDLAQDLIEAIKLFCNRRTTRRQ
jgi:putative resolvase